MTRIRLTAMSSAAFAAWQAAGLEDYARNRVRAGNWPAAGALERARGEYEALLPAREKTPGHHLYAIVDQATGAAVGMVWVSLTEADFPLAFLYNIEVAAEARGRGIGAAALAEVERLMAARGATQLDLQVFGFNEGAQALYRRLGYGVANVVMSKKLRP